MDEWYQSLNQLHLLFPDGINWLVIALSRQVIVLLDWLLERSVNDWPD